jgi:FAD/FMN-containing dehydrogenase
MRRRHFLGALSATAVSACAAAVVPSPSSSSSPPPSPSPTSAPSARPSPTAPSPPSWNALRAQLAGLVLEPATPGYDDARKIYNTRFDGIRPLAVAVCKSVADVQACVRFARANAVPLALRSGGHSYAGWSTGTGLVLDVSPLAAISVGSGAVTVGAGARLVDVYDAVGAAGAGIAAGSCPSVGVTGLTLGGGIGVLTRAWGPTCDQLTNIDIVTADGELRHCDQSNEPDLLWAARGGGGGNFGVVTALRFATHPITDLALGFLTWPWPAAAAVLSGWQSWMATAPDALWSTLHLEGGSAAPSIAVHAVQVGSAAEISARLDALVTAVGAAPDYRESGARSYRDVMLLEAGCLGRTVAACHLKGSAPGGELGRETYAAKSIVAERPLSSAAIAALVDGIAGASRPGVGGAAVLIDALGGAVSRIATDATAFPHRTATAVLQLYGSWSAAAAGDPTIAWLREIHGKARPLIETGAYVNYIDPDLVDWADAYYGANLARLRAVKARYDPTRLFDFPQAV